MSNIFNAKRFGKYLIHDIKSAWRDSGTLLILCAFAPLIILIVSIMFQLVFGGSVDAMSSGMKIAALGISALVAAWVFPSSHYGSLTEKRRGSDWLMLPASRLEKYLSILLVICVALPFCLFAVQFALDKLLTLIPAYGDSAFSAMNRGLQKVFNEISVEDKKLAVSAPYALYLSFAGNALSFTLGALFFKKSKIGKTIIAILIIDFALTMAVGGLVGAIGIDPGKATQAIEEGRIMTLINVSAYITYAVMFAALDILIYLRVKTLKH